MRTRKLKIESLESRTLLAAHIINDVLYVSADDDALLILTVSVDKDEILLDFHTGDDERFPKSGIATIDVTGSTRSDFIENTTNMAMTANGGPGDDVLIGGFSADTLNGGAGHDTLDGRWGNDTLNGDDGNDRIDGGLGNDFIDGGSGHDIIVGGPALAWFFADVNIIQGGAGNDEIYGGGRTDIIHAGEGHDFVSSNGGNDIVFGDEGNDRLFGGDGQDLLFGGDGDDGVFGGNDRDRDTIIGNYGQDRLLYRDGDRLLDASHFDAAIKFINDSSRWTDDEVRVADEAFEMLQTKARSIRILQDPWSGDPLEFYKVKQNKEWDGKNSTFHFLFWKDRDISISDSAFSSDSWAKAVVIHEVAHNFDPDDNNPYWSTFVVLHDKSDADNAFSRPYGKGNAKEDWATVWEAAFGFANRPNSSVFRQKLAVVDAFFRDLA
jgi:hypothetical protein